MSAPINELLQARDAYDSMGPDEQALARATAASNGGDRIAAVNLVKSKRAQGVEQTRASAEEDLRPRTAGENASSFTQGLADTLGLGMAPVVKGIGTAVVHPSSPIASFMSGYGSQKNAQQEADEQSPAFAGGGHLAGDIVNTAMSLTSPVKSAVGAVEDIAAGAKPSQVLSVVSPSTVATVKNIAGKVAGLGDKIPAVGRAVVGLKTMGASEGALALARALRILNVPTELAPGLTALEEAAPAAAAAGPAEATASNVPDVELDKGDLKAMLERLKGKGAPAAPVAAEAAPAAPADLSKQAEAFDPGGGAWRAWLGKEAPAAVARPELDKAAAVLAQKTGAGGAAVYNPEGIGTPTGKRIGADLIAGPSDEQRMAALQSIDQPKPPPSTTFQGDTLNLVDRVASLPPAKRVPFIHQVAAQFGKKTALNVAKAAGISMKLNPL